MTEISPRVGRRQRNKEDKLERITDAARELFDARGVDGVTTQQIADKADVGTGTLFLYAKNKGELLLMVQNSAYVTALAKGDAGSKDQASSLDAIMAIVTAIVECNRAHVPNGRAYLKEMVFGDPGEAHHRAALTLTVHTETLIAAILTDRDKRTPTDAADLAHAISAVMFLAMASPLNTEAHLDEVLEEIRAQAKLIARS